MLREWTPLPLPWLWEQPGSTAHATSVTPEPTLCFYFPAFSGNKSSMKLGNPKAQVRLPAVQVGDKSLFKLVGSPAPVSWWRAIPVCQPFPELLSAAAPHTCTSLRQDFYEHQLSLALKRSLRDLFCWKLSYLL